MIRLTMTPQWGRPDASIDVTGDVLRIEGAAFDFSSLPEGGHVHPETEPDALFIGPVRRIGGVIHAHVILHVGPDAALDQPGAPWTVDAGDGPVAAPVVRVPAPAAEDDEA